MHNINDNEVIISREKQIKIQTLPHSASTCPQVSLRGFSRVLNVSFLYDLLRLWTDGLPSYVNPPCV